MVNKPLGITLPIRLGASGYFDNTVDSMEQIRSNLTNLLLTRKGERAFQPDFGCDVSRVLFESNTTDAMAQAHAEIQTAISYWMPFITINKITTINRDVDGHTIVVQIDYTISVTNTTDTIKLVF
jgi:uncharacterized protein